VTAWTAIKDDILSFLSSFYNGTVDLDRPGAHCSAAQMSGRYGSERFQAGLPSKLPSQDYYQDSYHQAAEAHSAAD
jgi:hypothetical protein